MRNGNTVVRLKPKGRQYLGEVIVPAGDKEIATRVVAPTGASAILQAAGLAEAIMADPLLSALIPPQAHVAVAVARDLASAVKFGLPAVAAMFGRLRGPGKRRLAKAILLTTPQVGAVPPVTSATSARSPRSRDQRGRVTSGNRANYVFYDGRWMRREDMEAIRAMLAQEAAAQQQQTQQQPDPGGFYAPYGYPPGYPPPGYPPYGYDPYGGYGGYPMFPTAPADPANDPRLQWDQAYLESMFQQGAAQQAFAPTPASWGADYGYGG